MPDAPPRLRTGPRTRRLLTIRGARAHTLKGIDLDLPQGSLVAFTGLSGSGKSSLVFDTIHAEGQRRYLECLSPAARFFLGPPEKACADSIDGLGPTLAVEPRSPGKNPRSTVGTITEIQDYLRLLFARLGVPHCPACGREVAPQTAARIAERILEEGAGRSCVVLAPVVRERRGERRGEMADLLRRGFVRARVDGEFVRLDEGLALDRMAPHTIEAVVDRLQPDARTASRLRESVESALALGGGFVVASFDGQDRLYSAARACPDCGVDLPPIEPALFSFNSARGACPACSGSGSAGDGPESPCVPCGGARLQPVARAVTFEGKTLPELCALESGALLRLFEDLRLPPRAEAVAREVLSEVRARLHYLAGVGLGYLSLERSVSTLSGGEMGRVRLAAQLGAGLTDVTYVLDEPTIGLHPREVAHLLGTLRALRDRGNTVLVVEHDEDTIRGADLVVELGPGAGEAGGRLLARCAPADLGPDTPTGRMLRRTERPAPVRAPRAPRGALVVRNARAFNLKGIDVSIPVGCLVAVTGVSGSGKSSLVEKILEPALRRRLHRARAHPAAHDGIEGWEAFDAVSAVDQSPIGRTPRSNPATYTGAFDAIRTLFAQVPEARTRGWGAGRFSFNVPGGRCEACDGAGIREISLDFWAPVRVPCSECEGDRFHPETLAVRYAGRSIADVLAMSVADARAAFANHPRIARGLSALEEIGLGYLRLGQPSSTLSGGEAQRVKVASELCRPSRGRTLYLLDEPTSGLHAEDVERLLRALHRLVDLGNTVVVVEHNPDVILSCDRVLELGPGAGAEGGRIVAEGSPREVAATKGSPTGEILERRLAGRGRARRAGREPAAGASPRAPDSIEIVRARANNLQDLSVRIPLGRLVVLTGPSGAGKSTLALDTIFAEGRRRFVESLSAYARRFLGRLERAPVERIDGLAPAVAVEGDLSLRTPRSTVATIAGIHDPLRVLYARAGTPRCPKCLEPLAATPPPAVAERAVRDLAGERGYVLAPMRGTEKGEKRFLAQRLAALRKEGFLRLLVDGAERRVEDLPVTEARRATSLEVVLDRVRFEPAQKGRIAEAVEQAGTIGGGRVVVATAPREGGEPRRLVFSLHGGCLRCGFRRREPFAPRDFAFNLRSGACSACGGLGEAGPDLPCKTCGGLRLKKESLAVALGGIEFGRLAASAVGEAREILAGMRLEGPSASVASELLPEVERRLRSVEEVGLGYLPLSRSAATLSSGELRRLRLASVLGSRLTGVIYVLDEPTIGLHPDDVEPLLRRLREMCEAGATVIVVEHDESVVRAADWVIELGPGAGLDGGRVVAEGPPEEIARHPDAPTARWLRGEVEVPRPRERRRGRGRELRLLGARTHNLRSVRFDIPLGTFLAVAGPSGSGKSSLVLDTLVPALRDAGIPGAKASASRRTWDAIEGAASIEGVLVADARPLGKTPRATPATYTGLLDEIREIFSRTPEAKARGFGPEKFSPFGRGGRCPTCEGRGAIRVEMDFLADVWLPCEECGGSRFREDVLAVRFRGRSIADVLAFEAREALEFFAGHPRIRTVLEGLVALGLGYLRLGQGGNTLSRGEAQRVRLAGALHAAGRRAAKKDEDAERAEPLAGRAGRRLFLLDEPTAGLHAIDVQALLRFLHGLVDGGDTVVVVEHHPAVLASADRIVELGPGAGPEGGRIVAEGTPEEIAATATSLTGRFLPVGGRKARAAARAGGTA